ncbi:hypothetical protein ACFST9_00195 [Hymenobacter monticola]|uniref:Uncharacterized protein n=1 Tax=Hymenobacter monticola TaxID=1705399 RepID=A0ABY4BCE0_9BACT|nr:hypothetical protein [Hymenobacter monticola]UOE36818.1 hypothetical protein MTP16_25410 [Hymenobacter monticola]
MVPFPFLLDVRDAVFFEVLAYAAFYGLTLLAGAVLLLVLVWFKRRAKPTGAVLAWLAAVCVAGMVGEALWYRAHPGALAGPTYWRHGAVLGLGLALYLLFRLDHLLLNQKK